MKKILFIFLLFVYSIYGQAKPYVILVSIDAFRWDYLSRNITPNFTKIKSEGVSAISFQPAFPTKTFPNHISIITGMYPESHGIISNDFVNLATNERYRMGDSVAVRESEWYLGEAFWETAHRNGIISASYFWVGSELLLKYRHPDYFRTYDKKVTNKAKLDGVMEWLNLPAGKRPHFITVYFDQVDTRAHDFGPNSKEVNEVIKEMDGVMGQLRENVLNSPLKDSVNIIILSDHGMTEINRERTVNIEQIIADASCKFINTGPVGLVQTPKEKEKSVYEKLKKNEKHFKVYYKDEVPEYFHYSKHPFIPQIVIIADMGWEVIDNFKAKKLETDKGKAGDHGFDNYQLDMHGIFIAEGPAFKKNYATGTLLNIDVYPLLCKIFGIQPRSNIDGKIERIEFLLNNN
jgi:ectonucleotide pyrophosphatase/phosphodiesterase family member 5